MNTHSIPPLTPSAVEQLRTLIESAAALEAPMREWEMTLACGYTTFYRQHASLHAQTLQPGHAPIAGTAAE